MKTPSREAAERTAQERARRHRRAAAGSERPPRLAHRLMAPQKPSFELRQLGAADADQYNQFFGQGTLAHPDTLRITVADIAAAPFKTGHGTEGSTFVAEGRAGNWLGVVTVEREQGREKRRHIAWVLRMYVGAGSAGAGIGRALLRAAVARARELPGVEKVNLTVAAHNNRAVGLYESEGFRTIGHEEDAFRDPTPRAELTMSLPL